MAELHDCLVPAMREAEELGTVNRVFCSKSVKHTNVNVLMKEANSKQHVNQAVTLIDFKRTHLNCKHLGTQNKGIWFVWGGSGSGKSSLLF
jgi:type II secretory ATPase GspE/PulE/Tfp pilus assembly ATPase PilB-like protein